VTTPKQKSGKEEVPKSKGARSRQGVLKAVGPAIATILVATPARCSRSGRSRATPTLCSFTWYPSLALSFVGLHYR